MGLTLHWEFSDKVSGEEARVLIESLHAFASTVGFEELSDVIEWSDGDPDAPEHFGDWLLMNEHEGTDDYRWVRPLHVVMFTAINAGSEAAAFGLASHPAHTPNGDPTGLSEGYRWRWHCKTQYAGLPMHGGEDHFVAAHQAIISVLDEGRRLGLLEKVVDDCNYYENRDEEHLRVELQKWNGLIAAFVGKIKDRLSDEDRRIYQAAITEDPTFEHLEAKGLELLRGFDSEQQEED